MKKSIVFIGLMFFFMAFIVSGAETEINITQPNHDAWLVKSSTVHIRWTHGAFYDTNPRTCTIYCGTYVISPPVAVTAGDFAWTVGRKNDGTFMAQQQYEITIVCSAYSDTDGPYVLVVDSMPRITITAPVDGQFLLIGSSYTIRWTHSTYFDASHDGCQILCGVDDIAHLPVTNDQFVWAAGRKNDGTFLGPGSYQIGIESIDYWTSEGPDHEPDITLFKLTLPDRIHLKEISRCSRCFQFDPREFKFEFEGLKAVIIEIIRSGEVVATLGKFGSRLPVSGPIKIVLDQEDPGFFKRQRQGYELRVSALGGKILLKQAVQIEIVK